MNLILSAAGVLLVIGLLVVGYIKFLDPTDIDEEEEKEIMGETAEELAADTEGENEETAAERNQDDIDFYRHV